MKPNQNGFLLVVSSFIVFCLVSIAAKAQNESESPIFKKYFYLQPNAGISQYFGDLNENKYWNENPKFAFGAVAGYQISPVFGLRSQFMKTNLYSQRSDQNKSLTSNLWDVSLDLTFNINEIFAKYNEKRFLNFYLFWGAGYSFFDSEMKNISTDEILKEHSNQIMFILPIGAGASFRLSYNISINLEYGDRTMFHGEYLDFSLPDENNNVHYSYASAGIQIRFGSEDSDGDRVKDKKDLCPDVPGKIELAGCPDKDNDGISDADDACPDVAGKSEFNGCPDTDGDGIVDTMDACPMVAGPADLHGCPDKDGDGIADKDDNCPDITGLKNLSGCPDRDGDGIADKNDTCPDVKGLAQYGGCPDSDGDGIIDSEDLCVYAAGQKELKGCPDTDGDSIADKDDKCPQLPGKKDLQGCPDRDDDGVADYIDACPDEKGFAQFYGCPDKDRDGIPDYLDNCPEVAGVTANKGCPAVVGKVTTVVLIKKVTFASGSSEMLPTYGNTMSLDDIISSMKANPDAKISVTGFADGEEKNDLVLSEKRADFVIDYLEKKGISASKIKKAYAGKKNPISDTKTPKGQELNRRVEIKITK